MNTKSTFLLLFLSMFLFIFLACTSDTKPTETEGDNANILEKDVSADSGESSIDKEENQEENPIEIVYENKETQKAHEEIVKKYGEQWDFCTCIQKGDSINKALETSENDAEIDKIFARMEYVDNKCKGLLIQPNDTPEDRAAHQKKVNDCLR